jgi:hypothetical protein
MLAALCEALEGMRAAFTNPFVTPLVIKGVNW